MPNLTVALIVTLLGMGSVFAIIILLWGLIAFINYIGTRLGSSANLPEDQELANKFLAAIAAVVASQALATTASEDQVEEIHAFPLPPTAIVSPWQAVMRSKILNKRGSGR